MGIRLDIVAEKLKDKCSLVYKAPLEKTEISCAKLLQRETVSFEPGVIYIGRISDFPADAEDLGKSSFALLVNSPRTSLPLRLRKRGILLVAGITTASLFNSVQDILSSETRYLSGSARLLESLVQGKGIQNVVDIGSKLLRETNVRQRYQSKVAGSYKERENRRCGLE